MELPTKGTARRTPPIGFSILVVDEEACIRDLCAGIAREAGLEVHEASTTEQGLAMLDRVQANILIIDLKVPQMGGLEMLKRARANNPQIAVMVLTQYGTLEAALLQATQPSAIDCLAKPFRLEELRAKLNRLISIVSLDQGNQISREQLRLRGSFGGMTGTSPKMQDIYELIEKVSQHNYPVLILGESGTGKELVARSVHFSGSRKNKPFVPVDCSGLVPTLIESELFGYAKGAFTGALHARAGLLESAEGGTVFLDEIGDLPFDLQAKLLRALQEREVRPVGSTERVRINVRVIAATNRDLEAAIRTGGFRQELFFRLNVVQINLPPLRERKRDIPPLVSAFMDKFSGPLRPMESISEEAMGAA